jgi:hypothetical protein
LYKSLNNHYHNVVNNLERNDVKLAVFVTFIAVVLFYLIWISAVRSYDLNKGGY